MTIRKAAPVAILIVLTFLAFWPCLFNQFTNWDDDKFLTANAVVQNWSAPNLRRLWTMTFEDGYQPLTMFSFAIEHRLFGLNPFVYHLDNLLLHIANVCLVFFIILRIAKRRELAFVTALLFALHPLRVESVAWVSERKDVLFAFFYLLALWAYVKGRVGACFGLFVLACLAKHQAASLPLVLLLLDGNWRPRAIARKWPFFAAGAVFLLRTIWTAAPHWGNMQMYSSTEKIFVSAYAALTYLVKSLVPYQLCCLYASPAKVNGSLAWIVYASPFILAALLFLAFKSLRQTKLVFGAAVFFLITIALPLTTNFFGGVFIFDRYTYLPSIGVFLIVSYFLARKESVCIAVLVAYTLAMSWMTFTRCKVWFDGVSLWADAIKHYPVYAVVYNNRGTAYALKGDYDSALKDFEQAIALDPQFVSALNNRAFVLRKKESHF